MSLPKSLSNATMLQQNCQTCKTKLRKDVKQFLLHFKPEDIEQDFKALLVHEHNTAGVFCVVPGCDPNFTTVMEAQPQAQKRIYPPTNWKKQDSGVTRPPENIARAPQQTGGQTQGCVLCGKKRHVKTSDCPNNKANK